ncbi:hypothetical protein L596_009427 [Steinernema carpocapsae]|uniref:Uncharacterized protein n=1 Tax=Steinernema carpocapsae TaxID=34508 RepID=A0A4U5PFL5_STECR|nr:hypothetical protein L596_009427 [Steinernema carpocapsae]
MKPTCDGHDTTGFDNSVKSLKILLKIPCISLQSIIRIHVAHLELDRKAVFLWQLSVSVLLVSTNRDLPLSANSAEDKSLKFHLFENLWKEGRIDHGTDKELSELGFSYVPGNVNAKGCNRRYHYGQELIKIENGRERKVALETIV